MGALFDAVEWNVASIGVLSKIVRKIRAIVDARIRFLGVFEPIFEPLLIGDVIDTRILNNSVLINTITIYRAFSSIQPFVLEQQCHGNIVCTCLSIR